MASDFERQRAGPLHSPVGQAPNRQRSPQRATLRESNRDLTAILKAVCMQAGITLSVVDSVETLLEAPYKTQPSHLLILDCSLALADDMAQCLRVVTTTKTPVFVIHPHTETIARLREQACCEVLGYTPDQVGLVLLDDLRLLKVVAEISGHPHVTLSEREQQVYQLLAQGLTNRDITERLHISRSTVKTEVMRIKEKLGVITRADLITAYYRRSLH